LEPQVHDRASRDKEADRQAERYEDGHAENYSNICLHERSAKAAVKEERK